MELRPGVRIDTALLEDFVRRHGIRRLALFGSALRDDFTEHSDLDFLVEFEPDRVPGLFRLASMERELESLIGHPVDMRTYHDLSKFFRDEVASTARVLYAA
ncbi:MAG: nucleotidyltransferase domain-containing protein [Actinomycetota bacterium]|nr:nucleotidyltransferase domain-containing protein [Actinomycetota bacterium]